MTVGEGRAAPAVVPGPRAVGEALAAGRHVARVLAAGRSDAVARVRAAADAAGVPVEAVEAARLDGLVDGAVHQGVVALAAAPRRADPADLPLTAPVVVVDGITDPHNLGAIARSAEVAGAAGIVLPRRRRSPVTPAAEKAAAGAFSWLAVAEVPNVARALEAFARVGRWSVGLAGEADVDLWDCPVLGEPVAVVVGSEGAGLARLVRQRCDALARIPSAGRVSSLNASVAAGVALMEVRRRLDRG